MPIFPLPQYEADLEADRQAYAALKPPTSIVVRFGVLRMIGEYPYDGDAKPGCGSKLVCRTHRGTEIAEMLTTTCPNSGCGKSVSRKEMLDYVENSGGKDYPFFTEGRVLRIATLEDLNAMNAMEARKGEWLKTARAIAADLQLPMKVVDVEPVLGQERLTFHFTSEDRVDFRPMVMELARLYHTRIEMHQVGARDEARITADYEKCGQHCCCRQFLKVLKPISMKSAKMQKATLDPLKISGRCGRLMCCLRYEDTTYEELKKNLPHKKTPVQTPDGPGIVIDSQILTQLVLVKLDNTGEEAAYPVENLKRPDPNAKPATVDEDTPPAAAPGASQPPRSPRPPASPPSSDNRPRTDGPRSQPPNGPKPGGPRPPGANGPRSSPPPSNNAGRGEGSPSGPPKRFDKLI